MPLYQREEQHRTKAGDILSTQFSGRDSHGSSCYWFYINDRLVGYSKYKEALKNRCFPHTLKYIDKNTKQCQVCGRVLPALSQEALDSVEKAPIKVEETVVEDRTVVHVGEHRGHQILHFKDGTSRVPGLLRDCNSPWSAIVSIDEELSP